jgi:regulator of protease activity HflC (stomatin/prohibitin superfamily)
MFGLGPAATFLMLAILAIASGVKVIREYERAVIFRLGRLTEFKGAGVRYVIPFIDRMFKVDMRTVTLDVPPQDVITRDNVSLKVNAVLYFRVVDPNRAITEVENYLIATSQLAQTTLRSACGEVELDELLVGREKLNASLQQTLDTHTDPWGIKVVQVAVKHIDLPDEMRRAMARQAEAERERRAKVINAAGEFQAAERLAQASAILESEPVSIQLRFLHSLTEIATQNNSTTIFPVPIDLLSAFIGDRTPATPAAGSNPPPKITSES